MTRSLIVAALCSFVIASAACSSTTASEEPTAATGGATSATPGRTGAADDAVAMKELQASEKWISPRCRWLEKGVWVQGSPQEEAIYKAAYQMQFIEMVEVGQKWHLNRPNAPAWNITLTDRGKAESATCSATSRATSWGVPVSKRRFISGTFVKQEPNYGGRTVYEVDFEWVPTPVGAQVEHVLTRQMSVETGTHRIKVFMRKARDFSTKRPTTWTVDVIDDRGTVRMR